MPASRQATLRSLARAVATNAVTLDPGADRSEVRQQLLALAGIGEWTADYIVMRALGDPDTFLPGDLGIRRAGERLGLGANPRAIADRASTWRPWRTYATHQLWATLADH
jgi:AraC family transcriptional regulator, regulatory protein of adaptative response / DNA-3-methyladenine glycosylase II